MKMERKQSTLTPSRPGSPSARPGSWPEPSAELQGRVRPARRGAGCRRCRRSGLGDCAGGTSRCPQERDADGSGSSLASAAASSQAEPEHLSSSESRAFSRLFGTATVKAGWPAAPTTASWGPPHAPLHPSTHF